MLRGHGFPTLFAFYPVFRCAKARKQEQQPANEEPQEQVDPRKAAVEAAIARAKARKQEQQQANIEPEEQIDPRKAAVEAAIARA
ncbi:hypothetical protein, partial [Escherichia sp. E14V10]|uniref:hypothetical protein n=1 Tax=Escherichia sp. E14V10 TaxID=2478973 RepID=UPI0013EE7130